MGRTRNDDDTEPASQGMERGSSTGVEPAAASPTISLRPSFSESASSPTSSQTRSAPKAASAGESHLRRRSSLSNLHSAVVVEVTVPDAPASSAMQRVSSLTSFMQGAAPVDKNEVRARAKGAPDKPGRLGTRPLPVLLGRSRRRLYTSLARLAGLACLALAFVYLCRLAAAPLLPKVGGERLLITLETVPYPLSTHPRTPRTADQRTLSFADYLTTRLGSHFSSPAGNLPGRSKPGSQLWLTTATNQSVAMGARHLVAFIERLETTGGPSAFALSRAVGNSPHAPLAALENRAQHSTKRVVVTLCQDEACMEFCRRDPTLFCFGGFFDGRRHRRGATAKVAGTGATAAEIIKLEGILEAVQSGRRVFWVDECVLSLSCSPPRSTCPTDSAAFPRCRSGTYFKEDPVPYMGDLGSFDLQIPESWTTGRPNSVGPRLVLPLSHSAAWTR